MNPVKGKIHFIGSEQKISDNFSKAELVVETIEQYPQLLSFQFVNDKMYILKNFSVGQLVEVDFNLRGREWTDPKTGELRYFNSLDGWRVTLVPEVKTNAPKGGIPFPTIEEGELTPEEDTDPLPF